MSLYRKILKIPRALLRLGRLIDRLESGADSAEALLYLTVLRETWPEAAKEMMPRLNLPDSAIPDIASWYIRRQQPHSLQKSLNEYVVSMAECLVSLPLEARIALFEEALRIPSENSPFVFARYIRFMTQYGVDDGQLAGIGDRFATLGSVVWKTEFAMAWAQYMMTLSRVGRSDDAKGVLKDYKARYGLRGLAEIPSAALFARENGYHVSMLKHAADLMEMVRQNQADRVLQRFVAGKSLALVGSSPLECGRGRGAEIDSHDIVVRFNRVAADDAYIGDFGGKTTILSRNLSPMVIPAMSGVNMILIPDGLERVPVLPAVIRSFLEASRNGSVVCGVPLKDYRAIMREAGFPSLSTGVLVCSYMKTLVPGLSRKDLYGFSHFLDDNALNYGEYDRFHYYCRRFDERFDSLFHVHPLAMERDYLKRLFPD